MGLLDKAKSDREAGRPKGGTGLFSRALEARTSAYPLPLAGNEARSEQEERSFPYSASDLREFAKGLSLPLKGKDWLASLFMQLSSRLSLEYLAVFSFCAGGFLPLAESQYGKACPKSNLQDSIILPSSMLAAATNDGRLPFEAAPLFSSLVSGMREASFHSRLACDSEGKPVFLWIFADSRLARNAGITEALDALFAAQPSPDRALACQKAMQASEIVDGLELSSDHANALAFSFQIAGHCRERAGLSPGLRPEAVGAFILDAAREILGQGGEAFLVANGKLLVLLYARQEADPELGLLQFRKSMKRALPFLVPRDFPQGKAIAIDLSSLSSLVVLEDFASE